MAPLPELDLNLGLTNNSGSPMYSGEGEIEKTVTRTDTALKKHTIQIIISDQEVGKITMKIGENNIEVPTYKLTITDDKTNETEAYQVTRDVLTFVQTKTKKSLFSFFGLKKFDKTSFLYENIAYEPAVSDIEKYDISRHRKLNQDQLIYELSNGNNKMILYSGDIHEFRKEKDINQYFVIIDNHNGKSFIGDILYREKFLKITPKVELQIIKRAKVPKNFEIDEKGHIQKLIYL